MESPFHKWSDLTSSLGVRHNRRRSRLVPPTDLDGPGREESETFTRDRFGKEGEKEVF